MLPLAPLRVGRWIDRAAWPLHVTLVTNFASDADLDLLIAVVREAARTLPPLSGTVGDPARFGPQSDVLVDLVESATLQAAHEATLDALERSAGVVPLVPAYHRAGHRPHVTVASSGRATRGEPLRFGTLALAELGARDLAHRAVPVALLDLAAAGPSPVPQELTAASAVRLLDQLHTAGVHPWVIGGWGVDALIGSPTRVHHDLDVFVDVVELPALLEALPDLGMTVRSVWSENRWIGEDHLPSAFVADGPRGELDVHVVRSGPDGPEPLSETRIVLPRHALDGTGSIVGTTVRCATVEAQLAMHTGYELPEHHHVDVARLRALDA